MTTDKQREQAIQSIADMLRTSSFQVEFKVKKKPAGIKIIVDVTPEEMAARLSRLSNKTAT